MEHLYSKHQKYYNNKCDLYCLGIILYMFKTCEYIFEVKTLDEIIKIRYKNKFRNETDDKL